MEFDLGSFMLGGLLATALVSLVLYLLWHVDKKDEDDVYVEYRKVVDALKKEEQEE